MTDLPVHSEFGASQITRIDACAGSVRLSRGIEGTSSIYAAEGTVAVRRRDTREQVVMPFEEFLALITDLRKRRALDLGEAVEARVVV